MFLMLSLLALFTVLSLLLEKFYYGPKRLISFYEKQFQKCGLRVKVFPFTFMNYHIVSLVRRCEKQYNNSLQFLCHGLEEYDIALGNNVSQVVIYPLSPALLKDAFNQLRLLPKQPYLTDVFKRFGAGGGLPFTEGEEWKRKRKIISEVFTFELLHQLIPTICKCIDSQLQVVDQLVDQKQPNINVRLHIERAFAELMTKAFFGSRMKEVKVKDRDFVDFFNELLNMLQEQTTSLHNLLFGVRAIKVGLLERDRKVTESLKCFKAISREYINEEFERLGQLSDSELKERPNLLKLFLKQQRDQKDLEVKETYTVEEIIPEFAVFFGAGIQTSSNTVNAALHLLSENPKCLEKALFELKSLPENDYSFQTLKKMEYIEAIINQTLRTNGPANFIFSRYTQPQTPITFGGVKITHGVQVILTSLRNHFSPHYFKHPEAFIPERWAQQGLNLEPFVFVPFGAGERNCIGQHLARLQMKIVLAKFLRKYHFKALKPVQMKIKFVYCIPHSQFEVQKKES